MEHLATIILLGLALIASASWLSGGLSLKPGAMVKARASLKFADEITAILDNESTLSPTARVEMLRAIRISRNANAS